MILTNELQSILSKKDRANPLSANSLSICKLIKLNLSSNALSMIFYKRGTIFYYRI